MVTFGLRFGGYPVAGLAVAGDAFGWLRHRGVAGYRKESADDGLPGGDEAACAAAFVPPD